MKVLLEVSMRNLIRCKRAAEETAWKIMPLSDLLGFSFSFFKNRSDPGKRGLTFIYSLFRQNSMVDTTILNPPNT